MMHKARPPRDDFMTIVSRIVSEVVYENAKRSTIRGTCSVSFCAGIIRRSSQAFMMEIRLNWICLASVH